jgi:hypothetical protein
MLIGEGDGGGGRPIVLFRKAGLIRILIGPVASQLGSSKAADKTPLSPRRHIGARYSPNDPWIQGLVMVYYWNPVLGEMQVSFQRCHS